MMEDNIRKRIHTHTHTHTHTHIYDWVALLYNRNWQNIVNQVYFSKKKELRIIICFDNRIMIMLQDKKEIILYHWFR